MTLLVIFAGIATPSHDARELRGNIRKDTRKPMATDLHPLTPMRMKIHGGTALNDEKSLCAKCRFATIVRGRALDEEVVHCQSITTRGMRVTFKVTSCTSHSDIDQPTYMQLLEDAWILKPASKRRPAGFVRNSDLKSEEVQAIMRELRESERE